MTLHILNLSEVEFAQPQHKAKEERYSIDLGQGGKLKLYVKALDEIVAKLESALLIAAAAADHHIKTKEISILVTRIRDMLKIMLDDCQIAEAKGEVEESLIYLRSMLALFLHHINTFFVSMKAENGKDCLELSKLLLRIFQKYLKQDTEVENDIIMREKGEVLQIHAISA